MPSLHAHEEEMRRRRFRQLEVALGLDGHGLSWPMLIKAAQKYREEVARLRAELGKCEGDQTRTGGDAVQPDNEGT